MFARITNQAFLRTAQYSYALLELSQAGVNLRVAW